MERTNGQMTNEQITDAINQLITQKATNVEVPTLPSLDLQLPTGTDLESEWIKFLNRAAKDPDIVKYYQNLLTQAQGDTKLAISFLDRDYEVGTRQVKDNLAETLQKLGFDEKRETRGAMQDILYAAPGGQWNYAAFTETDDPNKVAFGGGGLVKQRMDELSDTQKWRREAEGRSARQKIEPLGLTREKGINEANQGLTQTAQGLAKAKQQDILTRGTQYYNIYQNKINADAQQKIREAASARDDTQVQPGGTGEKPPYAPNVVNQTVAYGGRTWRGQPGGDWA